MKSQKRRWVDSAASLSGIIERKAESELRFGDGELKRGDGFQFGGDVALGFEDQLARLNRKTDWRVGLMGVRVLACESFEFGSGWRGGLSLRCGLRGVWSLG